MCYLPFTNSITILYDFKISKGFTKVRIIKQTFGTSVVTMSVIILEHFPLYLSTLSVHKEWSSCLENPSSLPILLATSKTTSLLSYCLQPAAHVLRGKWQQLAVFEYFLNTHSKLFTHHYRGHFLEGHTLTIALLTLISQNFC